MEERPALPQNASRKRLRPDDRSLFKFSVPPTTSPTHQQRPNPSPPPPPHNQPDSTLRNQDPHNPALPSQPPDPMLPTSGPPTHPPILQPLHPPIPNFSAMTQAVSRSAPTPAHPPPPDTPGGMIYNIALPLPNPGRAHRFCQACDHVNHVRRKLCENCGTPKPSAVRNAVGVRPSNDAELQERPHQAYMDAYADPLRGGVSNSVKRPFRQMTAPDQRSSNPITHQAHSLAMQCPGDDIPLLGSTSRAPQVHPSYHSLATDPLGAKRLRLTPTLLSEPLINLCTTPHDQMRAPNPIALNSAAPKQTPYGMVDFSQKIFAESPPVERADQVTLPSLNGAHAVANHVVPPHQYPSGLHHGQPLSRQPAHDAMPAPGFSFTRAPEQPSLADEMLPVNRQMVLSELEANQRSSIPRYQGVNSLNAMRAVHNVPVVRPLEYADPLDGHQGTAVSYAAQGELYPQQQHATITGAVGPSVPPTAVVSHQTSTYRADVRRDEGSKDGKYDGSNQGVDSAGKGIGRYIEHPNEGFRADDHGQSVGRGEVQTGDASSRPDDGRFAIENILMQHKNNVTSG